MDNNSWRDRLEHTRCRPKLNYPNCLNPGDSRLDCWSRPSDSDKRMIHGQANKPVARALRIGSAGAVQLTCFKTLPLIVRSSSGLEVPVYAIIDEQSNSAFIDQTLLHQLGISPSDRDSFHYSNCTLALFSSQFAGYRVSNFSVRGVNEKIWIDTPSPFNSSGPP